MKYLICILLIVSSLFSLEVKKLSWPKGDTFLTFLQENNIDNKLYFNLEREDKELCSEIRAGATYYETKNEKGELIQALIEVSEEIQLQVYKDGDSYKFSTLPIIFDEAVETVTIPITSSPYQDILNMTSNSELANEFIRAYSGSVNFKYMRKNDTITIKYRQRIRLGQYHGTPDIISAVVKIRNKEYFIFKNEDDGKYYNEAGKSLTSYFFKIPLTYTRISSAFTLKRWHPVLKRYRAHLGIDYAAPRGRAIHSAADGRIVFRGRKGGYGNVIEIVHKNGYKTLYAHQSRFKPGLRVGSRVKQGQTIGYVGTTGVSTGPHLHFGLYKNGRAINPAKIVRVTKTKLNGNAKKKFLKYTKALSKELEEKSKNPTQEVLDLKEIPNKSLLKV
ncbi:peptidoglycan DD-metalloendopeptidase family protein [Arcobacter sp. F2176]|uniref:peptidoglycan DD-metalloendopeptidase family protein n=1 Tax=unclassified Arcobacter TaxID=2593671 RepID=UPI00100A938B|nr:peptidase M24 [Arcobacter sp. F2176]